MRCKLHDIVVIINDIENPINNGIMAKIVGFADKALMSDGEIATNVWEIESLGPWLYNGLELLDPELYQYWAHDHELLPIGGKPLAVITETEQPIKESA